GGRRARPRLARTRAAAVRGQARTGGEVRPADRTRRRRTGAPGRVRPGRCRLEARRRVARNGRRPAARRAAAVRLRFVLVDVFADRPLAGNPLAVFPEADGIPEEKLQPIAREMDHPATAFLLRPTVPGAAFRLRVFSREHEIPFAGHPTLGAHFVHALERGFPGTGTARVSHEGAEGLFEVELSPAEGGTGLLRLRHRLPEFGERLSDEEVAGVAAALGLS